MHSFIFHTHTTAVSRALHDPDPWRAQEQLHFIAQGFGGGTRIGDSLAGFNREHAARLLHSRTAVLIFSDGYDTGDPQHLSDALAELQRRARRVVWIHPLLDDPGFAPVVDRHAGGAAAHRLARIRRQLARASRCTAPRDRHTDMTHPRREARRCRMADAASGIEIRDQEF